MSDLQTKDINKVLYYSYLPDCRLKLPEKIEKASREEAFTEDYDSLIKRGKSSLKQSFDSIIENIDTNKEQVIPLSSGLDSRMILAHLINHPKIDISNIHTVTLGSPNTYDYEYGQQVSEEAGVKNTVINLQGRVKFGVNCGRRRRLRASFELSLARHC